MNIKVDVINNIKTNQLLRNLDRILQKYHLSKEERTLQIEMIATQFSKKNFLKYPLDENAFLILSKNERKLKSLKRYEGSPLPLLSSLEEFSQTIGDYNEELLKYGIKTREKLHDNPNPLSEIGVNIHLAFYKTLNSRGNWYLIKQYKRLRKLRKQNSISCYWKLSWTLMCSSLSFRIACLNSWQSTWYKTYNYKELRTIFNTLNKILNLEQTKCLIKNVWIESPKGKWRQLGIPNKAWRLYLHMLTMFISYIYEPHLSPEIYDGFIYNRGTLSWWTNLLWGKLLTQYPHIMEVDLASCFPNIQRSGLRKALISGNLIPEKYINLILTHLNSPVEESTWFPTFETYVENKLNKKWRKSQRSIHMGLGISPILMVITLDWVLKELKLLSLDFQYKWYADDGSFYFNLQGLYRIIRIQNLSWIWILTELISGRNLLITLLNNTKIFQETGLKICRNKSKIIKLFGLWILPYRSLGLNLYTTTSLTQQILLIWKKEPIPQNLMGWTRGRGANPKKRKMSTAASRKELKFISLDSLSILNLKTLIIQYKKYFGLLVSNLYNPRLLAKTKLPFEGIIKPQSFLWTLKKELKKPKHKSKKNCLNLYNSGCKLNELLLKVNSREKIEPQWLTLNPNLERELQQKWNFIENYPTTWNISNPIKKDTTSSPNLEDDLYLKYTELKITEEEKYNLRKEYEKQVPKFTKSLT